MVENTDKKLGKSIFEKWSLASKIFKTTIFYPGGGSARRFIPITMRLQEFLFLFYFRFEDKYYQNIAVSRNIMLCAIWHESKLKI